MRAEEAHQQELEARQWAEHRTLANQFRDECRDYLNHLLNRKGNEREHRPEQSEL